MGRSIKEMRGERGEWGEETRGIWNMEEMYTGEENVT